MRDVRRSELAKRPQVERLAGRSASWAIGRGHVNEFVIAWAVRLIWVVGRRSVVACVVEVGAFWVFWSFDEYRKTLIHSKKTLSIIHFLPINMPPFKISFPPKTFRKTLRSPDPPTLAGHSHPAYAEPKKVDGKKIIFLDVDGVLHSIRVTRQEQLFNPQKMALLRKLIACTGAEVGIASR